MNDLNNPYDKERHDFAAAFDSVKQRRLAVDSAAGVVVPTRDWSAVRIRATDPEVELFKDTASICSVAGTVTALRGMTLSSHGMRVTGEINDDDLALGDGFAFVIELKTGDVIDGWISRNALGLCSVTVDDDIWGNPVVWKDMDITPLFARHVLAVLEAS